MSLPARDLMLLSGLENGHVLNVARVDILQQRLLQRQEGEREEQYKELQGRRK